MRRLVPNEGSTGPLPGPDDRESLALLLRHAFPLGERGSFTSLLEAIDGHADSDGPAVAPGVSDRFRNEGGHQSSSSTGEEGS
jgi:hypothetical protein